MFLFAQHRAIALPKIVHMINPENERRDVVEEFPSSVWRPRAKRGSGEGHGFHRRSRDERPRQGDGLARVLLAEGNRGDVRLTLDALRETNNAVEVHVVRDGVEALAFLRREGAHVLAPRPDLILLDLDLPKLNGREILGKIKNDAELKAIPTIVLAKSAVEEDIAKTYQLEPNCYLTKPLGVKDFEKLIQSICDFWLLKATLPPNAAERLAV